MARLTVKVSRMSYGDESLNRYAPELPAQTESAYSIVGKGYGRAKVIVRLKLEEIASLYHDHSFSRYINRINLPDIKAKWFGFLSTNEIASDIGCRLESCLRWLQELKLKGVVIDDFLLFPDLRSARNGNPMMRKVHMWKIHNPLDDKIYNHAHRKIGYENPCDLVKRMLESKDLNLPVRIRERNHLKVRNLNLTATSKIADKRQIELDRNLNYIG